MRKYALFLLMVFTITGYAQKKKNGTVYIEHPAIEVVDAFSKSWVAGDAEKALSYVADDLKIWDGNETNRDAKPGTKEGLAKNMTWWQENIDYLSLKPWGEAYPDAIEYKDEDHDDVVWVQTWSHLKGMHKETGVKIDVPVHRLYVVNQDNKIKTIINYGSNDAWNELQRSYSTLENGTIYKNHDYINTVRKLIGALEHSDLDLYYSYFDDGAGFRNIHMAVDAKPMTIEEDREGMTKMLEDFEIHSIDVQGYPDYLNYGLGDAKIVQSWWKFRMKRKSDSKKFTLPVMLIHDFDDEGKIIRENAYYSLSMMTAK